MTSLKIISQNKCFDGIQYVFSHDAVSTNCSMRFGLYLPPKIESVKVPVLYWLSGLTCTENNFIVKAGAQRIAAELGIALIVPDTSPRGLGLAGEDDSYDFGSGAGFYLDATEEPWASHYRMYSYVSTELPGIIKDNFNIDGSRAGICGHSMGGHGALVLALRNPGVFKSVSAFSPICAPTQCPWGQKAFMGYLGSDRDAWVDYDATALMAVHGWSGGEILIDQGLNDEHMSSQLKPDVFQQACDSAGVKLNLRLHEGYDHSYFFVASFIEDHLRFHGDRFSVL